MTVRMRVPDAENQQRIREQAEAEGIRFVDRTAQRNALIMARHNLSCALGYWDELEKDNLRSYIEVAADWLAKLEEPTTVNGREEREMPKTITLDLTYDELSCLHGWGNFVKFTPGEDTFDARDERLHLKVYEAMQPWLAPCLGRPDLVAERR